MKNLKVSNMVGVSFRVDHFTKNIKTTLAPKDSHSNQFCDRFQGNFQELFMAMADRVM